MAKSTPCIDRSEVLAAEISGSQKGPAGNQAHRHATRRAILALHTQSDCHIPWPTQPVRQGTVTLRQAIDMANADTTDSQEVIGFAANLQGTIDLTQALPNLNNNINIQGPGATQLIVDRVSTAPQFSVFTVNSGVTDTISGLTITGGNALDGSGISNYSTLTVNNSSFINDSSGVDPDELGKGGGIYNNATLTVNNSSFTNDITRNGGGIDNNYNGGLIVNSSNFTDNTSDFGNVIWNSNKLAVNNSNFTSNTAIYIGGGIFNEAAGVSTMNNDTFTNNTAVYDCGGGIANVDGTITVAGSTFKNNTATNAPYGGDGGGIYNSSNESNTEGIAIVTGSTFTGNAAVNGGSIYSAPDNGAVYSSNTLVVIGSTFTQNIATDGGGIYNNAGTLKLNNTIVATNTGGDISGQIDPSSSNNLIGDGTGITTLSSLNTSNLIGTTAHPINPMLGPLDYYGGPNQTMALLPGSPAIDAGSNTLAVDPATGQPLAYDQRGVGFPRIVNGTVDIGAFESQGFTLTPVTGSTPQGTPVNSPLANPLAVIVTANNPLEPVDGGMVTFSAPASGASASLSTTSPVTIGSIGQASVTATANAIGGQYTVSASTAGAAEPASFVLTSQDPPVTVNTLADDPGGPTPEFTTLRDAINQADADTANQYVITFAVEGTIDLTSVLPHLANNITIQGPGASNLTVERVSTAPDFSIFTVNSGVTDTISGMTITGGNAQQGGGINNNGTLTATNVNFTANIANSGGGGIYNVGLATIINSTVTHNSNSSNSYSGGGIYNGGVLIAINSTFTGNSATSSVGGGISGGGTITVIGSAFASNSAYAGGGIYSDSGTLTATSDTFNGNIATALGGGICNSTTAIVTNSTFAGNSADTGGGIYNIGPLMATNSTFTDNSAEITGGGIENYDTLTLNNTIVADNTAPLGSTIYGQDGPNIHGQVQPTSAFNLIGDGSGITNLTALEEPALSNLIGTTADPINPLLAPLADYGGPTQTMALLPGSPAINAGSNALAVDANGNQLTTDQRGAGFPRIVRATVDIGAYELMQTPLTPIVVVVDNGGTYNGKAFAATATVNGQSNLEGVTPTLDYQQLVNGFWQDLGANAPINAGFYDVTAIFAGTVNYAAARSSTVDFTIGQATAKIVVTPYNVTYDGNAHTATGTATGVNSVLPSNDLNLTSTTHTNPGTYSDTWTFSDPNYVSQTGTVTDVINQTIPTIGDPSFEQPVVRAGQFKYDPTGSPWAFSGGSGISGNNSGFTSGNANAPQGTQVAFLQGTGSFTQSVANWTAGSYVLLFDAAQRGNYGVSEQSINVLIDGNSVATFTPSSTSYQGYSTVAFTVTAGTHTIEFLGLSANGDNTGFLDQVTVTPSITSIPSIIDPGFEQPVVGPGQFQYDPTGLPWVFAGGAGISGNNSPFTSGNPPAPQGTQVAFLQGISSFTQSVTGWAAGTYVLTFDAAQRGNYGVSEQSFEVLIDGNVVGTFTPSSTSYESYSTASFTVTAGTPTIEFLGLSSSGDNTAFLDQVAVAPSIGDPNFEQPVVGTGQFQYDPTGSPWVFTGGAGISGKNSGFTSGNPPAPLGTQVAFLQGTSTITQTVTGWAAGSYVLTFDAAQRGNYGVSEQSFEVLIDGSVVGTFAPSGISYHGYSTVAFTVTAGTYTIEFLGLSANGDNTGFLDQVTVTPSITSIPPIGDPSFEQPVVGTSQFQYDPTGSPWPFTGGAGISGNNSPSPRAIPPHHRESRSPSSREPVCSPSRSPTGQPGPTCSPSTPPSAATSGCRSKALSC